MFFRFLVERKKMNLFCYDACFYFCLLLWWFLVENWIQFVRWVVKGRQFPVLLKIIGKYNKQNVYIIIKIYLFVNTMVNKSLAV